jgi:hypothetical protein
MKNDSTIHRTFGSDIAFMKRKRAAVDDYLSKGTGLISGTSIRPIQELTRYS